MSHHIKGETKAGDKKPMTDTDMKDTGGAMKGKPAAGGKSAPKK